MGSDVQLDVYPLPCDMLRRWGRSHSVELRPEGVVQTVTKKKKNFTTPVFRFGKLI